MDSTITPAAIARIARNLSFSAASVAAGAEFANKGLIRETSVPGIWLVRSLTNPLSWYCTTLTWCSCASHTGRGHCKHQTALLVAGLAASLTADDHGRTPDDGPDDGDGSGPITREQRGALFAVLAGRYGSTLPRWDRLHYLSLIAGRDIGSVNDLTAAEARHAVTVLNRLT